ncbi:MAG TPA: NUDIX domain-containing protein [Candidatus Saccharimonadales bacterium]|nr:NUDIX domain-containing protein [Candidatus Saccharimonadales bacterium]
MPIQIVDEHDTPIGAATKQEAWEKGLIHRIVRLMVENDRGELLLQHRTPTKDIFPNCWDNSCAGHVDAGEDYRQALQREIAEELGWRDLELTEIGRYETHTVWQGHTFNRFVRVYKAHANKLPAKREAGKIDGFKWFSLEDVRRLVRDHPDHATDGLREVIEKFYEERI